MQSHSINKQIFEFENAKKNSKNHTYSTLNKFNDLQDWIRIFVFTYTTNFIGDSNFVRTCNGQVTVMHVSFKH